MMSDVGVQHLEPNTHTKDYLQEAGKIRKNVGDDFFSSPKRFK